MNEGQITHVLSLVSSCLQAFVIMLALLAFSHVRDERSWWWFVMASVMVFIRRLTGTYEHLFNMNTNVIEGVETIAISVMWILFIVIKTDRFRLKNNNSGACNGSDKRVV